jgi:hypothetical protein
MIVKLLGALDLFIALCFWVFGVFHLNFLGSFILILGFFLLIKGIVFATTLNIVSIIDIVCALIILGSVSMTMPIFIVIIVSLFLVQKGVFSMLS